jgi:hypothetical protein
MSIISPLEIANFKLSILLTLIASNGFFQLNTHDLSSSLSSLYFPSSFTIKKIKSRDILRTYFCYPSHFRSLRKSSGVWWFPWLIKGCCNRKKRKYWTTSLNWNAFQVKVLCGHWAVNGKCEATSGFLCAFPTSSSLWVVVELMIITHLIKQTETLQHPQ